MTLTVRRKKQNGVKDSIAYRKYLQYLPSCGPAHDDPCTPTEPSNDELRKKLDFPSFARPKRGNSGYSESMMSQVPRVQLLIEAYTEMLAKRSSPKCQASHLFLEPPSRRNRSRRRPYREYPDDRMWITWDTTMDTQRWLSDSNIGPNFPEINSVAEMLTNNQLHPNGDSNHSEYSTSATWADDSLSGVFSRGNSISSSAGSPLCCSEDDFNMPRSASCSRLPGRPSVALSEDSAVDLEFISGASVNQSPEPENFSRAEFCEAWGKSQDYDAASAPRDQVLKPPSVVISDYSGDCVSLRVAHMNEDFKLSSLARQASFVTEPLNDYGLSVSKICPRKVSDCSTCSSVSTVDMSPDSHLALDEFSSSRRSSCCSDCSSFTAPDSADDHQSDLIQESNKNLLDLPDTEKTSNWRKVKNVVHWTPFVQTYKRHKYPWVQLAGHQGNFKAGDKQGTIMKKLCPPEQRALERLMRDELRPYVPEYMGLVDKGEQEQYLELQDLLSDFTAPCVMDIKMGVRTYLEEELAKARVKPKLRKDMFDKMVQIDPNAPSDAEQRAQAVTKPRYMVWRETISSTATLGFRIEGVKKSDGTSSKDFKTTRSQEQVLAALSSFLQGCDHAPSLYLKRLKEIRAVLDKSDFFKSHELIGSSLLFVHNEDDAKVWLIDFAKSIPLPDAVSVSHKVPWVEGSHEDGYLIGLENLITLMASLEAQVNKKTKQLADKSAPKTSQSSYIDPVNQVKNSVSKIRTLQNDVLKGAALKLESFHQRTADSCRLTNSSLNSKPLTNSSSGQSSASISSVKILSENNKNAVNLSVSESKVVPDLRSTSVSSS